MSDRPHYEYAEISPAEFEERVRLAVSELDTPQLDEIRAHIRWFQRRYPTPLERLRYARRKYDEWSKTRGILGNPR